MGIAELKNNLHQLIVETDDANILLKVKEVFAKLSAIPYELSDYEKTSIKQGLKDIEEGRVYSHEEVRAEINEWIAKNS